MGKKEIDLSREFKKIKQEEQEQLRAAKQWVLDLANRSGLPVLKLWANLIMPEKSEELLLNMLPGAAGIVTLKGAYAPLARAGERVTKGMMEEAILNPLRAGGFREPFIQDVAKQARTALGPLPEGIIERTRNVVNLPLEELSTLSAHPTVKPGEIPPYVTLGLFDEDLASVLARASKGLREKAIIESMVKPQLAPEVLANPYRVPVIFVPDPRFGYMGGRTALIQEYPTVLPHELLHSGVSQMKGIRKYDPIDLAKEEAWVQKIMDEIMAGGGRSLQDFIHQYQLSELTGLPKWSAQVNPLYLEQIRKSMGQQASMEELAQAIAKFNRAPQYPASQSLLVKLQNIPKPKTLEVRDPMGRLESYTSVGGQRIPRFYHATPYLEEIVKSGKLSGAAGLEFGGRGLGGSGAFGVSATTSKEAAKNIMNQMIRRRIFIDSRSEDDIVKNLKAFVESDKKQYPNKSDQLDLALESFLNDEGVKNAMQTIEEFAKKGTSERRMDRILSYLFDKWLVKREAHAGLDNPIFVGWEQTRSWDPSNIGIIALSGKKHAHNLPYRPGVDIFQSEIRFPADIPVKGGWVVGATKEAEKRIKQIQKALGPQ